MVEYRGLECADKEPRGGRVDHLDRFLWGVFVAQCAEEVAFNLEDLGHELESVPESAVGVCLACIGGVVGCIGIGREYEVEDGLGVTHDECSADKVIVLEESKALFTEAVGESLFGEQIKGLLCVADGEGVYIAYSDREAVAFEVAAFEFVVVEINPEDACLVVDESGEIFWGFTGDME